MGRVVNRRWPKNHSAIEFVGSTTFALPIDYLLDLWYSIFGLFVKWINPNFVLSSGGRCGLWMTILRKKYTKYKM